MAVSPTGHNDNFGGLTMTDNRGTVGWLKKELELFPKEADWNIHFGTVVGILIHNPVYGGKRWIHLLS